MKKGHALITTQPLHLLYSPDLSEFTEMVIAFLNARTGLTLEIKVEAEKIIPVDSFELPYRGRLEVIGMDKLEDEDYRKLAAHDIQEDAAYANFTNMVKWLYASHDFYLDGEDGQDLFVTVEWDTYQDVKRRSKAGTPFD